MINECLVKDEQVVQEAISLCKWLLTQEKLMVVFGQFMIKVHSRSDLVDVIAW